MKNTVKKLEFLKPFHLGKVELINLGAFYTALNYVDIVWNFIQPFLDENTVVFDPACGYGNFLVRKTVARKVGNDIDFEAIKLAKQIAKDVVYFNLNFLKFFDRKAYGIRNDEKLIIVGNPPYNDLTSQAKKKLKQLNFEVDSKIKSRDLGISFLRAFKYLNPDIICVLHPLSYLIKQANFRLLKEFKDNYVLIDGVIISSRIFKFTSKNSEFPIIIALYRKSKSGMNYEYIQSFKFQTIDGKSFSLKDFEYIGNFIDKYPKRRVNFSKGDILFYTLRDINALKRNKTFIEKPTSNAIKVDVSKLDYYIYVDVFKDFVEHIPYYLGNLDIIFSQSLFEKYKIYFISYALKKWDFLHKYYPDHKLYEFDKICILEYFKELLGTHFITKKEKK